MTRILYLLDVLYGFGGTERQLRELIRHMDRSSFAPIVVTLYSMDISHEAEFSGLACSTRCLGIRKLLSIDGLRAAFHLALEIRRQRIDIVHAFFPDAGILGTIAGKLGGARVIIGRRDLGYWYTSGYLRVLRFLQRFVDTYLVNSQAVRSVVSRSEGVDLARVEVIYNGFFDLPSGPSRLTMGDLGFPEGAKLVGIVANLRPIKRLDRFVEMAAGIRDRQTCYLIVGHGEQRNALIEQAHRAGLSDRFRITHTIHDVLEIVKLFTVGLLTSESEGLSNTLVEYGLAGVPAVAFDVGGNREVIEDQSSGFLVSPYDVDMLRRRVEEILADETLHDRLGFRARVACANRFAGALMVDKTQTLYESLVRPELQSPARL
jgi:glycosyltransferase involved in cell wall biosynthesis